MAFVARVERAAFRLGVAPILKIRVNIVRFVQNRHYNRLLAVVLGAFDD
jgi:hypothetical protein